MKQEGDQERRRFGLSVAKAAAGCDAAVSAPRPARKDRSLQELLAGLRGGDRAILAQAISLAESTRSDHAALARRLVAAILPETGRATRLGITGVPGAGKSTFIEKLGMQLCRDGHRVAVLAVDPSSTVTGGSILGDRTRMPTLSAEPNAFIRPSPSGATLGGVASHTREAILLSEAAGFDVVLIETVGVGQSETAVAGMCDCFLLLAIPGAGDELQGIKRGVLELVDLVAVNKADGDNERRAALAARELAESLRFLRPGAEHGGRSAVPVLTASALAGTGIAEVWAAVERHMQALRTGDGLAERRKAQDLAWFRSALDEALRALLSRSPAATAALAAAEAAVREGRTPPTIAAGSVVDALLARPEGREGP